MITVQQALTELATHMFVGPVWPASILVCLMVLYTLIALLGLIELNFDAPEVDLDLDVDASIDLGSPDLDAVDFDVADGDIEVSQASGFSFLSGMLAGTIRWTNVGRMPMVIWAGTFTVLFWLVSYCVWHWFDFQHYSPSWLPSMLLAVRNLVLAVIATKFATQPAVGKFDPEPGYTKDRLLGATCEISSINAGPSYGQARFRTNAAPLLLNVRTDGTEIPKGTEVRIIDFDPSKRIYTVTEILSENAS